MTHSIESIETTAAKGAIIIALSQARRDIDTAIEQLRADSHEALSSICHGVDMLTASYRDALPIVMPVPVSSEPRVWNIDL